MRILHVGPSGLAVTSRYGGALQRRILGLAEAQRDVGHDVTIVSPGAARAGEADGVPEGVEFVPIPLRLRRPARDYEFLLRVRRALARRGFDVVHAHGSPEAATILRSVGERHVQAVDFFRYRLTARRWGHRHYTRALDRYDAVLPVSRFCADALHAFYPDLRAPVRVVPNGVDPRAFRPDEDAARRARAALGLPAGPLVVYLGRVCRQKGSDLLGPLARDLRTRHPDATVVAAGPAEQFGHDGPTPLTRGLEAQGVRWLGPVHESRLAGLLAAAAVVVLPTREDEMFGMAALEALSCGTPVVASNLGGIPEAVGAGGRLFEPGDAPGFLAATRALLDDPGAAAVTTRAGAVHARGFAWARIEELTAAAYRGEEP